MSETGNAAFLKILQGLPISAVIASTTTGVILWVNSRNMELAGASSPEQIVGRSILEFLEPDQHAVALRDIEAVCRGESPSAVVYRLRRLDGGSADVQIMSAPMVYAGQPAMLSLAADVSPREQALRALADSEERYRCLVEELPDGLVVAVDDTIVFANPAIVRALGARDASEVTGRSMLGFVDPAHRAAVRAARRRVYLKHEAHAATALVLVGVDGRKLETTAHTTLIRWEGEYATQTLLRGLA